MMNKEALLNKVLKIYKETDSAINKLPKVCEKGCYYCCLHPVRIVNVEEYIIIDYLEKHDEIMRSIQKNLLDWFAYFNKNTPNGKTLTDGELSEFEFKMPRDRYPCPFLVNNECSIYDARPIVCRTYIVETSATQCIEHILSSPSPQCLRVRKDAEDEILKLGNDFYFKPLVYAVAGVYDIENHIKPIERLSSSYGSR